MKEREMHRSIRHSDSDYYLNYLNISAHNTNDNRQLCSGSKFFSYINNNFGIKRLPYNLKLIDLISNDVSAYELCVNLPDKYFLDWENYPTIRGKQCVDPQVKNAAYYDVLIRNFQDESLTDFIHPYDTSLKEIFVNVFKTDTTLKPDLKDHPNGRSYRSCEYYLAYWRSYIIFETITNCMFIEKYLDKRSGTEYFKKEYNKVNAHWVSKYAQTFKRIANYRTINTRFVFDDGKIGNTFSEMSLFVLDLTHSSKDQLISDMTLLLELFSLWEDKSKVQGINCYELALELLRKDIYFLFEWLTYLGENERELIEKWSYRSRMRERHSQLADVLDFEELKFKETFSRYTPVYLSSIDKLLDKQDLGSWYNELELLPSFYPWIRSFHDLHYTLNSKSNVHLVQPRILDNLLVLTIRTEILIKSILLNKYAESEDDLKKAIKLLAAHVADTKSKVVYEAITGKDCWDLTSLRHTPEDIFHKIDSVSVGQRWSKEQRYFLTQTLKFIASRNYFAHHSYKDGDMNDQSSSQSRTVLISCLHTVLYVYASTKA